MAIYLDHAATSPLRPQAREAWLRAAEAGGNASSVHSAGRKAKLVLEEARAAVLAALNATGAAGLVFTAGATEANVLALHQARAFDTVIISDGEHDSVVNAAMALGLPVRRLGLTADGQADIASLERAIEGAGRAFVAIMLANNETGVINDVAESGRIVKAKGGWLHVDAVQALGKIGVDFQKLGADSLSFSAHKIGGGQGVGALVYDRDRTLSPLVGGGQELGLRAGTENIAGIAAFAAALAEAVPVAAEVMEAQRAVEDQLKALCASILGEHAPRVPGIMYVAQDHWTSALQLIHMDMAGICVSSGSACSSGKVKASRVVTAMGRPDLADKALRVSAGWTTAPDDWKRFFDVWSAGYAAFLNRHRKEVA